MQEVIQDAEGRMKKTIDAVTEDLGSIRTGRASAALFEKIKVDYYGAPTPLNQLATISIPEARLVVIQPWDKSAMGEIEKAIQRSELSLNPNNDGKVIRINIPPLTEERRKDYVKLAKDKAEQARVSIRNVRRDALDTLKSLEKDSDISEDEFKRYEEQMQKLADKYVGKINELLESKEQEILEI